MRKALTLLLTLTLILSSCKHHPSETGEGIEFTPKTPEELIVQANELLKTETQQYSEPILAEIAHFSAKLEEILDNPQAIPNGQESLLESEGIDIAAVEEKYDAMILDTKEMIGPQGIDALLREHNLGALLSLNVSYHGAVSGYPSVSVPLFLNEENVSSSSNVIFTGTAFSEALLIEIAYVVEQGTNFRPTPGLADKAKLEAAIKPIIEKGEDSSDHAFALDIYYSGLSTQFEVDKATALLRQRNSVGVYSR